MIRKLQPNKVIIKNGVIYGRKGVKQLLPFLSRKGLVKIIK